MTAHHDRVRAVLLVHGLETDRRSDAGEDDGTDPVPHLTARVTRVQARLDRIRSPATVVHGDDRCADVDSGTNAKAWMLAVYDAALITLCGAVGVGQSLADDTVASEGERQRVELELLSSVLPL